MASLIQMSEAIESGKIRFSGDEESMMLADWVQKRAANTEYISLLRKCE